MSVFKARGEFHAEHPTALAMWCSDGRFTSAVEELLSDLGHPRLDTMTLPGGPALLDMTSSSLGSVDLTRDAASFLVRAHHIREVVLIAHQGCGYYGSRYKYESPEGMQRRQFADLRGAARWIMGTHPGVVARAYFAAVAAENGAPRVKFLPVE
jgi:hypothetical protein